MYCDSEILTGRRTDPVALVVWLVLAVGPASCLCAAADVDISTWTGSFGELVQRITYADPHSLGGTGPEDHIRTAELLAAEGYAAEAAQELLSRARLHEELRREPWSAEIRRRITVLEGVVLRTRGSDSRRKELED